MLKAFFLLVAFAFLLLVLYLIRFFFGKPNITTDYMAQLNKALRLSDDESLNSAPYYEKAAQLFNEYTDAAFKTKDEKDAFLYAIGGFSSDSQTTNPNKEGLVMAALDSHLIKEALSLIKQGSSKPFYWCQYEAGPDSSEVLAIRFLFLSDYRWICDLLLRQSDIDFKNHIDGAAADNLVAAFKFGSHIKQSPLFIEYLTGLRNQNDAARHILDILGNYDLDSNSLRKLYDELSACLTEESANQKHFGFEEKLVMYDEIQRTFSEGIFGGHLSPRVFLFLRSQPIDRSSESQLSRICRVLFFHPGKKESFIMADAYWDFWQKNAAKTPAAIRKDNIDLNAEAHKTVEGNILLETLAPATGRIVELGWRNKTEVDAALCIIAVKRFQKQFAKLPESLNELVQNGYLKKIPTDPYSNNPLVYKRIEDNFTLYSVGTNFIDDGGKVYYTVEGTPRTWEYDGNPADAVFWPIPKPKPLGNDEVIRKSCNLRLKSS
jgi:hypothetical protein